MFLKRKKKKKKSRFLNCDSVISALGTVIIKTLPVSPRLTHFPKKRQLAGRSLMKMAGSRWRDRTQHKHFGLSVGRK